MNKFTGSIVAIVTPMHHQSKEIDYVKFKELIKWQIQQGTDGIVIAGSTGEAATLNPEEWIKLLEIAKQTADHKVTIIAGTGTNCTTTTIEKTILAEKIGVDAALIVTPYYNKPTQEGLKLHFSAIAEKTSLPILLYNVPSRTGCDLIPTTIAELANIDRIIGVKDATGKLDRVTLLRQICRKDFILLSGDDASFVEFMLLGGDGVISVTANVVPAIISKLCKLIQHSEPQKNLDLIEKIRQINNELDPLHKILMIESNPIPVKWLLAHLERIEEGCRSPLTTLSKHHHANVISAYQNTVNLTVKITEEGNIL